MALARHASRAPSRVSFPIATTSRRVNSLDRFLRPAHRVNATRRSRCSAHDVLHVLDGLLLSKTCEFISPHCHVWDSAFRGFAPCEYSRFVTGLYPHVVNCQCLPKKPQLPVITPAPALMIPPSGSCSSHGSVVTDWGFSPTTHPIPSWTFLLRASLRTRRG